MDSINSAIAAAQAAAQGFQQQQPGTAVAPAAPAYAPPATTPPARPRSLSEAMATAGAAVDYWLGVNEYGMFVDKDKKALFETLDVDLKLAECKFGFGCRYSVGANVQYAKSYDGVREVRSGKPWGEILAEAQRIDPKCRGAYDLADIPMTVVNAVSKDGKVKYEAGKRFGYTTSITGYPMFMAFVSEVLQHFGEQSLIPVQLFATTKRGPTGEYGLIGFRLRAS